jgi:hypothetical protein
MGNDTGEKARAGNTFDENPPLTLQESILAVMAFDKRGSEVFAWLQPAHFDEPANEIAEQLQGYWQKYQQPPGLGHLDDLFTHEFVARPHGRIVKLLRNLALLENAMNAQFVLDQVSAFRRQQDLKATLIAAADRFQAGGPDMMEDVEGIWQKNLGSVVTPSVSITLPTERSEIQELFTRPEADEFGTGIPGLDARHLVPGRGQLTVLLGVSSAGKTWGLIQFGKAALLRGKRVLHVTLELSAVETSRRYLQAIAALPRYFGDPPGWARTLTLDASGRLVGFGREEIPPLPSNATACHEDTARRFSGRLRILYQSAGTLKVTAIRAAIARETTTGFKPDLVIVDYLGKLAAAADNYRIELGRNTEALRALAEDCDVAMVSAQQINRAGNKAELITRNHIAEDYSAVNHADAVVVLNRTPEEERLNLARLWVDKNRNGTQSWGLVIAQNYALGQFCTADAPLHQKEYTELLAREPLGE